MVFFPNFFYHLNQLKTGLAQPDFSGVIIQYSLYFCEYLQEKSHKAIQFALLLKWEINRYLIYQYLNTRVREITIITTPVPRHFILFDHAVREGLC